MPYLRCFKLLPLITVLSACTFGEGPELISPETDQATTSVDSTNDSTPVAPAPVQPQEVNAQPAEPQMDVEQTDTPAAETPGVPADVGDINNGTVVGENVEPNDATVALSNVDESQTSSDQTIDQNGVQDNIVRIPRTDRANAPVIDGDTIDYIGGTELLGGEWRFCSTI